MKLLDSENADHDLTSLVTVLTHTPSASSPCLCQCVIALGDGDKNLDGTGGVFEITVMIDDQVLEPNPQAVIFSTVMQAMALTTQFPVASNSEVVIKILSPNAGDSDVDVTAYLYDLQDAKQDTVDGLVSDLSKVPKSDGSVVWNVSVLNSIGAQVSDAMLAYVVPSMTDMAQFDLELLNAIGLMVGNLPTADDIADQVWDEALSGHDSAGTTGARLNDLNTASIAVTSAVDGNTITLTRFVTFSETISGLTIAADWEVVYLTIKRRATNDDPDAIVQIKVTNGGDAGDGLQTLNQADPDDNSLTAADGSLTVNHSAGMVAVYLTDEATAALPRAAGMTWDIKVIDASGDSAQAATGRCNAVDAETQALL